MLFASGSSSTIPEYSGILPSHSKNCSLSQQQLLQGFMQLVLPQSLVCKQNLTLPITISSLKQPINSLYPPITEQGFLNLRLVDYTSGGALIQSDTPHGYDRYLLWAPNSQDEWKLARIKPWFHPQHHIKAGVVVHAYNPRTPEVEVERWGKGEHVCGGMLV